MFLWLLATALAAASPVVVETPAEWPAQVMALPPELQARLHDEVLTGQPSQRLRFNRLLHMVLDVDGLDLHYADDATASVAETYASRSVNCLSFTLLFVALAREAGLEARPQEIRETLDWHQADGVFYRTNHVNAVVRVGKQDQVVDIGGETMIALDPPAPVSDQRLLAFYYNNLAVGQFQHGQITPALQTMATALALDPGYAPNWSNAGVLYLRSGDLAGAERAYVKALSLEPNNSSALFNMATLAERKGDQAGQARYRRRLERQQQHDPLHHFLQAISLEHAGDYPKAIKHYRQAIRLHDGEHRFHAALAQAYLHVGNTRSAIRALTRAKALSSGAARAGYEAQLAVLQPSPK